MSSALLTALGMVYIGTTILAAVLARRKRFAASFMLFTGSAVFAAVCIVLALFTGRALIIGAWLLSFMLNIASVVLMWRAGRLRVRVRGGGARG